MSFVERQRTPEWPIRVGIRNQLEDVVFLVDDADYLGPLLAEDGYRFRILAHGNRNVI
jgi:hypothetical protein